MKKTILLACIASAFIADLATANPDDTAHQGISAFELSEFLVAQNWDCSRKTCSQISSCAEACYKLTVCGHRRRDGDGDGIPCESLCSSRCR
ncbi:excalibur calcium-binding domain-containing protein [Halocynthiibacter styelae]|uniref:Excalibur calcium-binding domain-containing protein n=1 Tax=Halocynthiibacter styelae TaxID=2761955 RepID=A0A8J7LTU5_9RHOB|nr:excalibur calcium-binding domain-containing protein [Paenihalocynthiibacter styelae]